MKMALPSLGRETKGTEKGSLLGLWLLSSSSQSVTLATRFHATLENFWGN